MTTPHRRDDQELFHATVVDRDDESIGKVKDVFLDDSTGQPSFVIVAHGLTRRHIALPLRGSSFDGETLRLALPKALIDDAPKLLDANKLTAEEMAALTDYYGV